MSESEGSDSGHGSEDEHAKKKELAASCATRPLTPAERKKHKAHLDAWFSRIGELVVGATDKRLRWRCGLCQDLLVFEGNPSEISEHIHHLHPEVDPSKLDEAGPSSSTTPTKSLKMRAPREFVVDEKGTTKDVFTSLEEALAKAREGDTVLIKPGKYGCSKPLVIGERVTIKGASNARSRVQIFVSGKEGSSVPRPVLTLQGGTGGLLSNLMIKGSTRAGGILVRQGPWVISNCEIQGDTGKTLPAVQLGDTKPTTVEGCAAKVTGCELHGGSWGVYIAPGAGRQIEKCDIHDCAEGGVAYRSSALNCFIDSNVVHDIQGPAILVDDEATGDVEGNIFWACDGVAVSSRCKASFVNNKKYKQEPPGGAAALLPTELGEAPRKRPPREIEEPEPEKIGAGCGNFYSWLKILCMAGRGVDDH